MKLLATYLNCKSFFWLLFMDFLFAPPPGFNAAVDFLNVLDTDSLHTIASEACLSAFEKRTFVPPSKTDIASFSDRQISSICNALSFIYKGSLKSKLSAKVLNEALPIHTDLDEDIIFTLVSVYHRILKQFKSKSKLKENEIKEEEVQNADSNGLIDAKNVLNLGRLVKMDYCMGITVSSSRMKKVNKPFVRLSLQIAHGSGDFKTYFVTLSLLQFEQLREEIKVISMIMKDLD